MSSLMERWVTGSWESKAIGEPERESPTAPKAFGRPLERMLEDGLEDIFSRCDGAALEC